MAQAPIDVEGDWRIQRYMAWLCTPPKDREPRQKQELAEELGVTHRTLNNWSDNAEFLKAWEKLYLKTIGDPGVKMRIMQALERTATDPDDPKHVQAAKAYFEIEGSLKPTSRVDVHVSKDVEKLTDDEIKAMMAEYAQQEANRRAKADVEDA